MKNKKIAEALNEVDDRYLSDAAAPRARRPYWIVAVAAVLALVIALSLFPGSQNSPLDPTMNMDATTSTGNEDVRPSQNSPTRLSGQLAEPTLPTLVPYPIYSDYSDEKSYFDALTEWQQSQNAQFSQPKGYADSLTDFFLRSNREFLTGEENQAFSPVNVYLAMAMLAETTDGNSRQQILNLFGADSIESIRTQAGHMWNAHYNNDGQTTLLLANSVWLHYDYTFRRDTVDRLASLYSASVFTDNLRAEEATRQLQTWLNEMTGGLLKEQAGNIEFPPATCFALASTIYFKAGWETEFPEELTTDGTFHAPNGDATVSFMRNAVDGVCYYGSNFCAVRLELTGNNGMWIILPNEGVTVAQVLAGDEYLQMTLDPNAWENRRYVIINIRLPKFDVTGENDLIKGMQNLGLSDIFDPNLSDFTPMTLDSDRLFVSQINHAARVTIDENGVEAAAFTVIMVEDEACPSDVIDFVVDRPFLFVISGQDHLPLFSGVVTNP